MICSVRWLESTSFFATAVEKADAVSGSVVLELEGDLWQVKWLASESVLPDGLY